ncbi:EAL domain-containing protein [Caldichromatium japonicum]|uniref:EAL domain-containing protein n=1 Tax=Caldichromatium japonicum TaxID=2699430 RepID=A0A6G7VDT5_9GAMM|nr:EAL domain-containing protein [Caldichromatium japonicum]QIK37957.1 EAL domain-containing protein [Caldichromatium japonicum]
MPCPRCQILPLSSERRGTLLLTAAVRELIAVMGEFLRAHGLAFEDAGLELRLADANLVEFIERVRDSGSFNTLELQAIWALLLEAGESLSFQSLTRARTLEQWLKLLDACALIEILEAQRFVSWFQPILAARDGGLVGYESLLRGIRPDGGLMFPGEIFTLALANDLLFQVDRQARETALRCAAEQGLEGQLFVNFVPTAIYDPRHCLQSTVGWARRLGFDPGRLVFEVVETERVADFDHLKHILDFYRDAGYRVALDDVGSGYASLNLLATLKPDIIKIDMEIVRGVDRDPQRQSVLRALIGIARDLGIQTLAEGIETATELAYVLAQGVDLVQGYLFARPAQHPQAPYRPDPWPQP